MEPDDEVGGALFPLPAVSVASVVSAADRQNETLGRLGLLTDPVPPPSDSCTVGMPSNPASAAGVEASGGGGGGWEGVGAGPAGAVFCRSSTPLEGKVGDDGFGTAVGEDRFEDGEKYRVAAPRHEVVEGEDAVPGGGGDDPLCRSPVVELADEVELVVELRGRTRDRGTGANDVRR